MRLVDKRRKTMAGGSFRKTAQNDVNGLWAT
jgi:hypothetical protein